MGREWRGNLEGDIGQAVLGSLGDPSGNGDPNTRHSEPQEENTPSKWKLTVCIHFPDDVTMHKVSYKNHILGPCKLSLPTHIQPTIGLHQNPPDSVNKYRFPGLLPHRILLIRPEVKFLNLHF